MLDLLSKNWWILAVRGVFALLFGSLCFASPAATLWALILIFGGYALADGIVAFVAAARAGEHTAWFVVQGLLNLGAAVVAVLWPGMTALALLFVIAGWAIASGIVQILVAFRLRKEMEGEGWVIASGIATVAFGALLFARPGAGALAMIYVIGAYALLFGVVLIGAGLKFRGLGEQGVAG